jgi:F-box/leucine-rich repeat protein 14
MQPGRFRFGMKPLFAATTLLCVLLAMIAQPIMERRSQQALLYRTVVLGGNISEVDLLPEQEFSPGRFLLSIYDGAYGIGHLYSIDLRGSKVSDDDLDWIVQLHEIKELNLANTPVTDAGVEKLGGLEYLSSLNLGGTRVTDQGIAALGNLRDLARLRVIDTGVTDDALEKLDTTLPYAHFREERAIEKLKAAGIQVVGGARLFDGDKSRGLSPIRSGDKTAFVIVGMGRRITLTSDDVLQLSHLQSLQQMTFHTVTIGPSGLKGLRPLANMKSLRIYVANLTDKDLEAIARQTQLEKLEIQGCTGVTDVGLLHLRALTNLQELSVGNCPGLTREGIAALERELPKLKRSSGN